MGSPKVAVPYLEALIQSKYNVVAVYSQPARPKGRGLNLQKNSVHVVAENNNIQVFTPNKLDNYEEIKNLENLKIDIAVVMGYGNILPKNVLKLTKFGFVNIHLSLLPEFRGASPIEYALLNGKKETGVTIFKIIEKLDAGPIIINKKFFINNSINKDELEKKLNILGVDLLLKALPKYLKGELELQKQDEIKASYSKKINSNETQINFFQPTHNVYNKIRAFSPKPGAGFEYNNERFKILSCLVSEEKGESSTILNKNFTLGCLDKSIQPLIIQREGKKTMRIEDFIRGFKFSINDKIKYNDKV